MLDLLAVCDHFKTLLYCSNFMHERLYSRRLMVSSYVQQRKKSVSELFDAFND